MERELPYQNGNPMIRPNQRLVLTYPKSTLVQGEGGFEQRHLIVRSVRDLVAEPLTLREFQRRPLNMRSRWIVTAVDLDLMSFRNFYLGNSVEFQTQSDLRVGLYRPGEKRPFRVVGSGFEPTRRGRIRLAKVIGELRKQDFGKIKVGIFADDLRVRAIRKAG